MTALIGEALVTPAFRLSQDEEHVFVAVTLPESCGASSTFRAVVDGGCVFGLACEQFHLPLVFPGGESSLVNGRAVHIAGQPDASSSDDAVTMRRTHEQELVVALRKQRQGLELPELSSLKPSIFGPTGSGDAEADEEERLMGLEILKNGLKVAREKDAAGAAAGTTASTSTNEVAQPSVQARSHTTTLRPPLLPKNARSRIHEASENHDASGQERLRAAWNAEDAKWDEGMYLDNFVDEDGEIKHLIEVPLAELLKDSTHTEPASIFTMGDACDGADNRQSLLTLIDVLLAQAYDTRTTLADPSVESIWTICKLARSLSAASLPHQDTPLKQIVIGTVRRQLSYPLYRNWQLSMRVIADVIATLRVSQKSEGQSSASVSSRLAALMSLLEKGSGDDDAIVVYLESVIYPLFEGVRRRESSFGALADELEKTASTLEKADVGPEWDLEALEAAATEALAQGEGGYV